MNYSDIINALEQASGFDLFRLQGAIGHLLGDPQRVAAASITRMRRPPPGARRKAPLDCGISRHHEKDYARSK